MQKLAVSEAGSKSRLFVSEIRKAGIKTELLPLINAKIAELDQPELNFYVGITSRANLEDRIAEHSNIHGMVTGFEISKFSSFADLCFAENAGITHLFELVKSNVIKSCWNKTLGYDVGTFSAFCMSSNLTLYLLWADQLNCRDNESGALARRRGQEEREPGKVWILNNSCNVSKKRYDVERHLYMNQRVNAECDLCGLKFPSRHRLKLHVILKHKIMNEVFSCKLCKFVGSIEDVRGHVKVKSDMIDNEMI